MIFFFLYSRNNIALFYHFKRVFLYFSFIYLFTYLFTNDKYNLRRLTGLLSHNSAVIGIRLGNTCKQCFYKLSIIKSYKGDLFIEIQIRSILLQFTVSWICRIFLIIRLSNWGIKYHVKNSFNCNIVSPYISTLTIKLHKNSVVFCPNIVLIGRFAGQTRLD